MADRPHPTSIAGGPYDGTTFSYIPGATLSIDPSLTLHREWTDDQPATATMIVRGETVDGDDAVVRTALARSAGREMSLDYRMHTRNDRWWVYDLIVDGISLVANYRAQFNKNIRASSYEALIGQMKAQVDASASSRGEHSAP